MNIEDKHYYTKTFTRHEKDLVELVKLGKYRFNEKLGIRYIDLVESFSHVKGELAGRQLVLEEWQKSIISIAFGWEKLNGKGVWIRRFRTIFIFIPRKNGKTLFGSACVIADSIIRSDYGGEIAFFATKKDQAKLAYNATREMLYRHPILKTEVSESYSKLLMKPNNTEFYALGRDSKTLDGLNVSVGLADEQHAHPTDELWDVVKSSQSARLQPLMLSITTAGFKITSPAYALYEYSKKVLEDALKDESLFAFIAEPNAKPEDDPNFYFKESTWKSANPNYGVSVSKEEMRLASEEAKARPDKLNNFLVKYLNVWTNGSESYLPIQAWKKCIGKVSLGKNKIVGIDLSVRDDFTAVATVCMIGTVIHVKMKFYIPKDTVGERERELGVPLISWVNEGHITATDGSVIDLNYLERDIMEYIESTEAICYDPYRAKQLIRNIKENGFDKLIPIRQGYLTLSEPTAWLLRLIKEGKLVIEYNPVMDWMVSNMIIITDPSGNIKPDKGKPNNKIDGVVALINTLAYLIHVEVSEVNVYEERGLRTL